MKNDIDIVEQGKTNGQHLTSSKGIPLRWDMGLSW